MEKKMSKNLLIDGNHAMHRAFYSVPNNMTAPDKVTPTNAVHGFFQIMVKAIDVLEPNVVIVCWDKGKNQERKTLLPTYKDGRAKMDDSLKIQFNVVRELLDTLLVPQYRINNCEADDLLGSIAKRTAAMGHTNFIFSGDRDMFQLVNNNTLVAAPKKGGDIIIYNETKVFEEYGIYPHQYVDYIGIKGDPSDAIKGIEGLGAKTAAKLIQEHNNLDMVISAAKKGLITGKVAEKIIAGEDIALLSKKIATINTEIPLELNLETSWGSYGDISGAFTYYGLNTILKKLNKRTLSDQFKKPEKEPDYGNQGFLF